MIIKIYNINLIFYVIKKYFIEKNNYDDPIYIEEITPNIINKYRSNNWKKKNL